jgi:hypothetical protein
MAIRHARRSSNCHEDVPSPCVHRRARWPPAPASRSQPSWKTNAGSSLKRLQRRLPQGRYRGRRRPSSRAPAARWPAPAGPTWWRTRSWCAARAHGQPEWATTARLRGAGAGCHAGRACVRRLPGRPLAGARCGAAAGAASPRRSRGHGMRSGRWPAMADPLARLVPAGWCADAGRRITPADIAPRPRPRRRRAGAGRC